MLKNLLLYITVSTFILASCGGGGGGGGSTPTTPITPTTPALTVNLSAEPTSVLVENTSTLTWSSTNATSCSASWTSQTGTSGSETETITTAGNNSFSISCTGDGGSRSASVTVEGYRNTDGVVVDGYISGAEVFIDEDEDWLLDSNENSTTSDNDGKFTIKYANGNLVSIGGTDLDSQTLLDNLLITHKLTGHSDFKAITPVTSVAAFMEDALLVNAALGIDSSIDVFIFDPVANKGDGGINDYLYEKGNQLTVLAFALQNIANNLNTTTETTQDYFKAITEEIEKEYTETETKVDIETEAFVTKALDNVIAAKSATIDETAKVNVTKALSGMLPIIQVKSSDDLTTGVIRFAVSTLQTDIQAIANGTATTETVTSYTEDLLNYIAEDQSIDSSEIAPDINAISDSATTSEDTEIEINVLLNDSYVTSSPFSLSATNGTNGSTSISNNLITYSPDTDYNGSDSFSYTLTQGDKTSSADVTVTIEAVNDAPSIDVASTIQVEENQTAVTTISVSDVDEDELILTLDGADADSFNLSDENVLTFIEAPDYETKSSYAITLSLTDGTETVTKDVTITIIDVEENGSTPAITSSDTFNVNENQTAIGTVTATDADGDDITFSISSSEININASTGVLTFVSAPDYEAKSSYTATVTASGNNSSTQDITVNINNLNDTAPIWYFLQPLADFTGSGGNVLNEPWTISAYENSRQVAVFYMSDADESTDGDNYYNCTSDGDAEISTPGRGIVNIPNCYINIGSSGADYETKSTYTFTVTGSDGVQSTTSSTVTINIINTNDNSPQITSNNSFTADENQTAIATVSATDADDDTITFSISGSELAINSSGVLTFISAPDYETKPSYTATISATDGTNSITQNITVNVNNLNDNSPSFTSNSTFSADENQTAIGTVIATDTDGDSLTYSISGTDTSSININPSGVLTFASAPNYEIKSSYSIVVTANDGTYTGNQSVTVSINDVAESPPSFTSNSTFNVNENETAIGTVSATSSSGSAIIYSISGTDASAININSSSGELTFASAPDYETKNSYSAVIKAVETSGGSAIQTITINILNVLEFTQSDSINGSNINSYFGENGAIDINANGDVIAIGERYQAGRVHVYKNNSGWTQLGSPIDGEEYNPDTGISANDNAYTVSLSGDGMRIAIGASRNDGASNTIGNSGHVRVYEYFNNSWSQLGSDIDGTGADDAFGTDIDISGDGNRLIVWVPNDDDNGSNSGSAIVYEFLNGSWSQIGSIISGISAGDGASGRGGSVAISTDGTKILVGTPAGQGYVRAYEWSSNNWTQMGSNITGSSSDCLGTDVQFSGNGNSIIAGSYCSNSNNGAIKIYSYTSNNWSQKGNTIDGASSDYLGGWGSKIDISHDGNRIAFGTSNNDGLFKFYEYQNNSWSQVGILSPSSGNKINGLQINAEMTSVIYADYRYNSNRGRVSMMDIDFVPSTTAPSITTSGMNINEESGSGLVDSIQTSDSENDSLTYYVGGIDGNHFSMDASTGYLYFDNEWIDYENPQDSDSDNYYEIRAYVTDGILWSSKEISVRVLSDIGTQSFGADIVGTTNFQGIDASVALSDDGKRLVIGYPYDPGGGTRRGSVKVFENTSNNDWTQIGSTIFGSSDDERLGSSVDISGDGNRIIIGANASDVSQARQVRMYYWALDGWARMLTDYLNPPNSNYTQWGYDVAIDDDGDRIAIISASANTNWQNDNAGAVRVYQIGSLFSSPTDLVVNYNGSARQFMEGSSNGYEDNAGQRFYSVDMNNDGTALMISLVSNSTNLGPGGYRVFTNGGTSTQQGSTWTHRTDANNTRQYETCSQNGKSAGFHAAMTGDTIASNLANARIVCGSPGDPNPSYTGDNYHVEIDKWNENYNGANDWENIHTVTTGNNNDRRGERVAISDNGNYVLYSAPMSDDGSTDAGQIKLLYGTSSYTLQSSTSTINGSQNGESCGSNIAISGSGRIIAMHCEGYDGSSGNAIGRTKIFINK